MRQIQISRLRDLAVEAKLEVTFPVALPTGPKTVDADDDIELTVHLPGGVRIDVHLTAAEYERIANAQARAATQPLALEVADVD